jgi:MFS transporter, ACS family, tartrate transporter
MNAAAPVTDAAVETSTMGKLLRRVVPLLGIACMLQGLDQLNISFAGLQMRADLGFSATVFGLGSGLFFITYTIFGIPSNLLLLKFGPRRWLAGLLCAFGPITAATALVTGPHSYYALRLLLGIAEAGFVPGVIYAVGQWFPEAYRGRMLAWMLACNPIAASLGAPLSGWLLELDGVAGLRGWQWLFIVEGLPVVLLAWTFVKYLPEHPLQASWLSRPERDWLARELTPLRAAGRAQAAEPPAHSGTPLAFLADPTVLGLAAVFVCGCFLPFAVIFFIPQIINEFGVSKFTAAILSSLPAACGVVSMLAWTQHSDHRRERVLHAIAAQSVSVLGAALVIMGGSVTARMAGLCLVMTGVYAFLPLYWTFPTALLRAASAAGGIALINGLGGVAGFLAPYMMGVLRDQTGSYNLGVTVSAGLSGSAALMLLFFRSRMARHAQESLTPEPG